MGRLLPDGKTGEKGMISEQISAKSSVGGRRAASSCRMLGARGKARAAGMRASRWAELVLEEGAAALCPGPIPSRAAVPVPGLRRRSLLTRAHIAVAGHGQASCYSTSLCWSAWTGWSAVFLSVFGEIRSGAQWRCALPWSCGSGNESTGVAAERSECKDKLLTQ
jgi:hypothetical protein